MKKKNYLKDSKVISDLVEVGIFQKKNINVYSNKTRDRNIKVLRDEKSGVIFIPRYKSKINDYYKKKKEELFSISHNNIKNNSKKKITKENRGIHTKPKGYNANEIGIIESNDERRRFNYLKSKIKNKTVLDFGCGSGNFLLSAKKTVKKIAGLEVRKQYIDLLSNQFKMYDSIENVDEKFDFITLFHVLEHIPNQIETLKNLKKILKKNGKLIIEVPHANDVLLNLKTFRNFTLWSEHLVLHTKFSLSKYLNVAGYDLDKFMFVQRYNFFNHFGWFIDGKPGGHKTSLNRYNKDIINYYNKFIIQKEISDTLFVEASIKKA
jgi:2-polyprenyl-3-methyl-5-hydroxy-6-metoxy-1,4-benzoquinol methylase